MTKHPTKKLTVAHYVCFDKKFIPQQIDFLNRHFSDEIDQTFFVHGAPGDYLADAPDNVISLNKKTLLKFLVATHFADRVIFNALFSQNIVLVFSVLPWVLRKSLWLPWGGDLYWRQYHLSSRRERLFDWFKGQFVKSLYAIATPTLGDYETAKKWYGGQAKYINAGCNIFNFWQADLDRLIEQRKRGAACRIQIGNSGDPTNEHLEAMELLSRFAVDNIQIYAPLTYGNKAYIEQVINKGKLLFGERFIPLTEFMAPDEYNKYLSSIDVVILNHRRQQGFGNVVISLYLGAKVYLRRTVSTWAYLSDDMGCVVNDTDRIGEMSFQQLSENTPKRIQKNQAAVAHLFDRKWQKKSWSRLYSE